MLLRLTPQTGSGYDRLWVSEVAGTTLSGVSGQRSIYRYRSNYLFLGRLGSLESLMSLGIFFFKFLKLPIFPKFTKFLKFPKFPKFSIISS